MFRLADGNCAYFSLVCAILLEVQVYWIYWLARSEISRQNANKSNPIPKGKQEIYPLKMPGRKARRYATGSSTLYREG